MCKELKLVLSGGLGTSTVEGKGKDKKTDNNQMVKKEEEDAENVFIALGGIKAFTEREAMDSTMDPMDEEVEVEHLMSDRCPEKSKGRKGGSNEVQIL